ncbi:putative Fe-containing alcohol dehydrogenase [Xylaria flabelliformis]|nr:putative Fe-containing alcohol dehydrogenase [Xylaria flabelliformis]
MSNPSSTPAFPLLAHGAPFTTSLLSHINDTIPSEKIYVIASASLAKNTPHLNTLKDALGVRLAGLRVGMRPHTFWSEVLEVIDDVRRSGADCVVTLGAGSLTDAAKIVVYAIANSVTTSEELGSLSTSFSSSFLPQRENTHPSRIPVICIPTTLSGGEYSSTAGATNDADGRKYAFSGVAARPPRLVILDPELAMTTPRGVWLSTGVRALDHCVETLCSLQSNEGADASARRGLMRLVPALLRCCEKADDHPTAAAAARLDCFLGARDSMAAANSGVPMGASHGIGHQLGPAGVGHGETSCILNPAVCKYNYAKKANVARQDAVTALLWADEHAAKVFEERGLRKETADLGDAMDAIIRALGLPRTLKEFGIGEDKLDGIAEHSLHDRWVKTNPAHLDKEGVLEILRMVLG